MAKVCRYENDMLNQLPPELREDCRKVWQELIAENQCVVFYRYNLGCLIKKTIQFEKDNPDSKGNIEKIKQILHISSEAVMDTARRLAMTFTFKELQELTKVTSSGFCLRYSHFVKVMKSYLTKEQMLSYLFYARKYSIMHNELEDIIKKDHCRNQFGNREKKSLTSARAFIKEATSYLEKCLSGFEAFSDIPAKVIKAWKSEMSKTQVDEMVEQLNTHLAQCKALKEKLCK